MASRMSSRIHQWPEISWTKLCRSSGASSWRDNASVCEYDVSRRARTLRITMESRDRARSSLWRYNLVHHSGWRGWYFSGNSNDRTAVKTALRKFSTTPSRTVLGKINFLCHFYFLITRENHSLELAVHTRLLYFFVHNIYLSRYFSLSWHFFDNMHLFLTQIFFRHQSHFHTTMLCILRILTSYFLW